MAKFFQVAGQSIGLLRTDFEESLQPVPGGAAVVPFDAETNAALLSDFDRNHNAYAIAGGQLQKNGVNVAVQSDGQPKQDRDGLLNAADNAVATNGTYLAISNPTNAQVAAQVRALTQQNNRIIPLLVRLIRKVL